ncbi:hypothetical protein T05_3393 [Trichinella murrelli]|uniref:Uncharacterized protein n=1 Tax=Trichinella murrelli TaxID=144512 RepID=A0A0V0T7T7_9BILA|nr:hypothetical protein T05_3393 [Trichinella murrelli]
MLLESRTLFGVLLRFVLLRLKSYNHRTFLAITRQIRINKRNFWKVLRQINAYVLNKWLLKLQCAYLNTQGSSPSDTPLKRIDDGKFFIIIMRFLFILRTIVQYFLVLGNSIFLHFRSISIKLIKVVSLRFAMCIKSSIY